MTEGNLDSTSEKRLVEIIRSLLNRPIMTGEIVFDYLPGGYSNDNYRFDYQASTYVLRVPNHPRPFVDRSLELAFYQQSAVRIPVPELIALDTDTGNMLTRYEPGDLLADSAPNLDAIVDYMNSFHAALPTSARAYDPLALSRVYLSAGGPPGNITRLADITWQPSNTMTCHNDLNPWNVIQSAPGRWITLDWEWFGNNDPLFDLVTLHEGLTLTHTAFGEESLNELATRWAGGLVAGSRLEQCLIAFWLREYAWAWAERQRGRKSVEIQEQIEAASDRLKAFST